MKNHATRIASVALRCTGLSLVVTGVWSARALAFILRGCPRSSVVSALRACPRERFTGLSHDRIELVSAEVTVDGPVP